MPESKQPCVYILANKPHGSLYIDVTSNLCQRLYRHRQTIEPDHISKYGGYRLVHFEMFDDMERAIARERQLTTWHRVWKISLIETENVDWTDLAASWGLPPVAS